MADRCLSGVAMTLATTEPGVQVYDGRAARRPGRATYEGLGDRGRRAGPTRCTTTAFPQVTLAAGDSVAQVTEWRFAR